MGKISSATYLTIRERMGLIQLENVALILRRILFVCLPEEPYPPGPMEDVYELTFLIN